MKKINITIFYLLLLLLNSCESHKIKDTITGLWSIESLKIDGKPILNKYLTNTLYFKKDKTCELPIEIDGPKEEENGEWSVEEEKSDYYLNINSSNKLFNDRFLILSLRKVKRGNGHLYQMILQKENHIVLICYRM